MIWGSEGGGRWRPLPPTAYLDEAELHDRVQQAPNMLPLAGSPRLTVLGREVRLGAGSADLLAVESSGRLVIIEVKLAGNAESRRAVVAQVLSYAGYLQGLDPVQLESSARSPAPTERPPRTTRTANDGRTLGHRRHDLACECGLFVAPKLLAWCSGHSRGSCRVSAPRHGGVREGPDGAARLGAEKAMCDSRKPSPVAWHAAGKPGPVLSVWRVTFLLGGGQAYSVAGRVKPSARRGAAAVRR